MSVYADGHAEHDRQGADSRLIEVCWRCAADWLAYIRAHPEEHPTGPIVLAQPAASGGEE